MNPVGPQLTVVVPAFNEADSLPTLLREWQEVLGGLDFEFRLYDDGSTDATGEVLRDLQGRFPRLVVTRQTNRGHGPTVLRGYKEADGIWILQVDADGEISPDQFSKLWEVRDSFDLVLGYRVGRKSPLGRRLLTLLTRTTIRTLFGKRLRDVNTPFRLMRQSEFRPLLEALPTDCLTPNVLLCGLAARRGLRIHEVPVVHRGRAIGGSTLGSLRVWRFAWLALKQALKASREAGKLPA